MKRCHCFSRRMGRANLLLADLLLFTAVLLCGIVPSHAQEGRSKASSNSIPQVEPPAKSSELGPHPSFKDFALIGGVVATLIVGMMGVYQYRNGVALKRTESAVDLYNAYDSNQECILAMTMVDYFGRNEGIHFKYKHHITEEPLDIEFSSELFRSTFETVVEGNSIVTPYAELDEQQRAIRYIVDVWIGSLERAFFCVHKRYFKYQELVFYRYWMDLFLKREYEFLKRYAHENSCGMFIPFLEKYEKVLSPKLNRWLARIDRPNPIHYFL